MNLKCEGMTRRQWLAGSGLALGAASVGWSEPPVSAAAPLAPVSIAKAGSYGEDLVAKMAVQFDQIGGLAGLVRGKTVTIKLNLTGGGRYPPRTAGQTHWVHKF